MLTALRLIVLLTALTGDIRFPLTPIEAPLPDDTAKPIDVIKPDEWYVITSTERLIALASPEGLVEITEDHGPAKYRGRFSGGSGIETRAYGDEWIYLVEPVKAGKTELILIPVGAESADAVVRQVLTVSGTGPQPPPEPDPEPGPVASFRVIFVKESGQTLNAAQSAIPGAREIREYLGRKTTAEAGTAGWREYDPDFDPLNEPPTMRALWAAVKDKVTTVPCLIIEINGHATIKPFPSDVADAMKTLKQSGGE